MGRRRVSQNEGVLVVLVGLGKDFSTVHHHLNHGWFVFHKSHNAVHLSISHKIPFYKRNVHVCTFLSQNGTLWDICLMHRGICEMGLPDHGRPNLQLTMFQTINISFKGNSLELICHVWPWLLKRQLISEHFETLRPRQNGHHFADDIWNLFSCVKYCGIFIEISVKFVPRGPINNPALVQKMAWHWWGNKPIYHLKQWWSRTLIYIYICITLLRSVSVSM